MVLCLWSFTTWAKISSWLLVICHKAHKQLSNWTVLRKVIPIKLGEFPPKPPDKEGQQQNAMVLKSINQIDGQALDEHLGLEFSEALEFSISSFQIEELMIQRFLDNFEIFSSEFDSYIHQTCQLASWFGASLMSWWILHVFRCSLTWNQL